MSTTRPGGRRARRWLSHSTRDEHVIDLGRFGRRTLGTSLDVLAHLPPDYDPSGDRIYPVLYMLDGQNVFDGATAFLGQAWQADRVHDDLAAHELVHPFLIVAISGGWREQIYTPVEDPSEGAGGQLDGLGEMIERELQPFVLRHFRAMRGPAATGILGSSLGGLAALCLGWRRPDLFGIVGAMSPSLWWGGEYAIATMAAEPGPRLPMRVWIDAGTEEDDDAEEDESSMLEFDPGFDGPFVPGEPEEDEGEGDDEADEDPYADFDLVAAVVQVAERLDELGHEVELYIDEGAGHTEAAWRNRLPRAFEWLFGIDRELESEPGGEEE